jgi:hypothetical protein
MGFCHPIALRYDKKIDKVLQNRHIGVHSGSSTFLQRGSPPPPPWRLLPGFYNRSILPKLSQPKLDAAGIFFYCLVPLRGGVAQLVRALPCHGRGYGFEPRHSRHFHFRDAL